MGLRQFKVQRDRRISPVAGVSYDCLRATGAMKGKYGSEGKCKPYNPAPANDPSKPTVPCACRFPAARQQLRPIKIAKPNMSANISIAAIMTSLHSNQNPAQDWTNIQQSTHQTASPSQYSPTSSPTPSPPHPPSPSSPPRSSPPAPQTPQWPSTAVPHHTLRA